MTERLILQFLRLQNALFYNFLPFERLILQFLRLQNALFYKFLAF